MENNVLAELVGRAMDEREISLRCMSRDTGLGVATCFRVVHGIGEPRTRTVLIVCTYLGIALSRDMIGGYITEEELSALRLSAKERLDYLAVKEGKKVIVEVR